MLLRPFLIAIALSAVLTAPVHAQSSPTPTKETVRRAAKPAKPGSRPRIVVRRSHDYGFLPGYRPWVAERKGNRGGDYYPYWPGAGYFPGAGWYRGHFTNGLGPCWTRTPIGPIWNCG